MWSLHSLGGTRKGHDRSPRSSLRTFRLTRKRLERKAGESATREACTWTLLETAQRLRPLRVPQYKHYTDSNASSPLCDVYIKRIRYFIRLTNMNKKSWTNLILQRNLIRSEGNTSEQFNRMDRVAGTCHVMLLNPMITKIKTLIETSGKIFVQNPGNNRKWISKRPRKIARFRSVRFFLCEIQEKRFRRNVLPSFARKRQYGGWVLLRLSVNSSLEELLNI